MVTMSGYESPKISSPSTTAGPGIMSNATVLLDRLGRVLDVARRMNGRIHGPEPKAVSSLNQAPPTEQSLARILHRSHDLLNEIDGELDSLEGRL